MSPTWNPGGWSEADLRSLRDAGRINDYGRAPAPVHQEEAMGLRVEMVGGSAHIFADNEPGPRSVEITLRATPRLKTVAPALSCSSCRALPVRVHAIEPERNPATGHKPPAIYRCVNCGHQMQKHEAQRGIS